MKIEFLILISSFILTVILNIIIIPYLKRLKIGQVIRTDGPENHFEKTGTPTMGGITILITLVIILSILALKYQIVWLIVIAITGSGIVGAIDDYKKLKFKTSDGISAKKKMLLLFAVASIFIILFITVFNIGTDIILPFTRNIVQLPLAIYVVLAMLVFLATTNAINLTDGLDGLASGIVVIIMTFFTSMAIKNSDIEISRVGIASIGSILGFLIFNIKPAKVFMGDVGSLLLGGLIASISLIMKMPLYLIIIALIPVIETLSTALQVIYFKITKGKRLFKMAPIHHHLELSGYSERKIVIIFWIISAILCITGFFI